MPRVRLSIAPGAKVCLHVARNRWYPELTKFRSQTSSPGVGQPHSTARQLGHEAAGLEPRQCAGQTSRATAAEWPFKPVGVTNLDGHAPFGVA